MNSRNGTILHNTNYVVTVEVAFVDPRRCDPDPPLFITDRYVTARSCRHAVPVDSVNRIDDLVSRVQVVGFGHIQAYGWTEGGAV